MNKVVRTLPVRPASVQQLNNIRAVMYNRVEFPYNIPGVDYFVGGLSEGNMWSVHICEWCGVENRNYWQGQKHKPTCAWWNHAPKWVRLFVEGKR